MDGYVNIPKAHLYDAATEFLARATVARNAALAAGKERFRFGRRLGFLWQFERTEAQVWSKMWEWAHTYRDWFNFSDNERFASALMDTATDSRPQTVLLSLKDWRRLHAPFRNEQD